METAGPPGRGVTHPGLRHAQKSPGILRGAGGLPAEVSCRSARDGSRGLARVQDDLGPAFLAGVEVLAGLRGLVKRQVVGDDPGGLDLVPGDESSQVPVVALDRALPVPMCWPLKQKPPTSKRAFPFPGQLVGPAGGLGDVDADGADAPLNRTDCTRSFSVAALSS
jgi:hypothetical protein